MGCGKMKKAGLVINPHIEKHIDTGLVVDSIGTLLGINEWLTSGERDIQKAIARILREKPDVIIGIGGDGTMNFIASSLIKNEAKNITLLGVGAGTGNVGPLISLCYEEIHNIVSTSIDLEITEIDAIEVRHASSTLGYAFVDVMIANYFPGSIDGKFTLLDAKKFLESKAIEPVRMKLKPVTEKFYVEKNEKKLFEGGKEIEQVAVALLYDGKCYVGKVACGILCAAVRNGMEGVVVLSDQKTMGISIVPEKFVKLWHLPFSRNDLVMIGGIAEGTYLIIDGNPIMHAPENLEFIIVKNAVRCYRKKEV